MSSLTPNEIQHAIINDNVTLLRGVKGIGGKTAQRIILDLKDKIAKLSLNINSSSSLYNTIREEALSALTMLGFSKNNIDKFVDNELKENANLEVEELVKRVLKKM